MKKLNFYEKGQTILEVMIALAVASIIISAVVVAVVSALSNERFGISQNQATQLAQEGLDHMRNLSQTDWDDFLSSYTGGNCLGENEILPSARIETMCAPNIGTFVREIIVEQDSIPCGPTPVPPLSELNAKVTSVVRWSDGKCTGVGDLQYCHKVELISCYFK